VLFKENYDYNIAHPTISEDGKVLVFSSDNIESKGQTDLFMSVLMNSSWSKPISIANLNTIAVETFPHFHGNTLYFSSDRANGIGGLDIYECHFHNDQFSSPEILDKPFNSEFDDFLFIPINETEGLFSSNRNNTTDKIFHFNIDLPQPKEFIEINDNFCFDLADEGNIDSTRFKHYWKMGDGSEYSGQKMSHCFKDTGKYIITCDLMDTKNNKTDVAFITTEIDVDIKTPTIKTQIIDQKVLLSIDQKYSSYNYSNYYWIINGKIHMEKEPSFDMTQSKLNVKLILWEEKDLENSIGLYKKITLKP
jgi:hypothetical protein